MEPWDLSVWQMLGLAAAAGLVGGIINLFVAENAFVLPGVKKIGDNTVFQPGFVGTLIAGAVAAALSWMMYGPAKDFVLARTGASAEPAQTAEITLTFVALGAAVILGFGGAKWLSAEVDKRLLKAAIAVFAQRMSDARTAARVAGASPSAVADVAASL